MNSLLASSACVLRTRTSGSCAILFRRVCSFQIARRFCSLFSIRFIFCAAVIRFSVIIVSMAAMKYLCASKIAWAGSRDAVWYIFCEYFWKSLLEIFGVRKKNRIPSPAKIKPIKSVSIGSNGDDVIFL